MIDKEGGLLQAPPGSAGHRGAADHRADGQGSTCSPGERALWAKRGPYPTFGRNEEKRGEETRDHTRA
jgi:hypothetical protein